MFWMSLGALRPRQSKEIFSQCSIFYFLIFVRLLFCVFFGLQCNTLYFLFKISVNILWCVLFCLQDEVLKNLSKCFHIYLQVRAQIWQGPGRSNSQVPYGCQIHLTGRPNRGKDSLPLDQPRTNPGHIAEVFKF